jgi:hypothetical protein
LTHSISCVTIPYTLYIGLFKAVENITMNKKILLTSITAAGLFLGAATPAQAYSMPEFGSCLNPQWNKTQENHGSNHGVVGIGSFSGVDTIYESNGNVLQCLCVEDGRGYQTNWLKADKLSQNDIDTLKTQGWIVAHGKDWGLHDSKYMAKNIEYTCAECTPTPTPVTGTPTPTESVPGPTATPKPEEKKEAPVLGGLAPTGNAFVIYMAIMAGAVAVAASMVLRKFNK